MTPPARCSATSPCSTTSRSRGRRADGAPRTGTTRLCGRLTVTVQEAPAPVGQQHARKQPGRARARPVNIIGHAFDAGGRTCGSSDPMGSCVACYNRAAEARKGRNAKLKAPATFSRCVCSGRERGLQGWSITRSRPATRPRPLASRRASGWQRRALEHRPAFRPLRRRTVPVGVPVVWPCRAAGAREGHDPTHWQSCGGAPSGPGWALAEERVPLTMVTTGFAHAWFTDGDGRLKEAWVHTDLGCAHCRLGVPQVRVHRDGIEVRCEQRGVADQG